MLTKSEHCFIGEVANSNEKCTLKIWVNSDNSVPIFELRVFEDQVSSWPYPHEMSYLVKGNLPSSIYGPGTITKFTYQTIIEDDLIPLPQKEIFDVTPSENVSETTVGPNSTSKIAHLLVPPDFLYITLDKTSEQQLTLKWRRFYRKWEVDKEGFDVFRNGMDQEITFKTSSFTEAKQVESEMKTRLARCAIM